MSQDSPPPTRLDWRYLLIPLAGVLLLIGLGAEPYLRQDPAIAAALDYARTPAGRPPPEFHLNLARASWLQPVNLGALPLAVFLCWLTFGPPLLRAPRAARGEDEVANAIALACLPTGLALTALLRLPPALAEPLEASFASLVPIQLVPVNVALTGAVGLVSVLGALWFRLRRPLSPPVSEPAPPHQAPVLG